MHYAPMTRYPVGSVVQRQNGYYYLKDMSGQWIAEHRLTAARGLGRDLLEGERVFHKNGKRDDNSRDNLVVVRFNLTKFKNLPHRRVIYVPAPQKKTQYHRAA